MLIQAHGWGPSWWRLSKSEMGMQFSAESLWLKFGACSPLQSGVATVLFLPLFAPAEGEDAPQRAFTTLAMTLSAWSLSIKVFMVSHWTPWYFCTTRSGSLKVNSKFTVNNGKLPNLSILNGEHLHGRLFHIEADIRARGVARFRALVPPLVHDPARQSLLHGRHHVVVLLMIGRDEANVEGLLLLFASDNQPLLLHLPRCACPFVEPAQDECNETATHPAWDQVNQQEALVLQLGNSIEEGPDQAQGALDASLLNLTRKRKYLKKTSEGLTRQWGAKGLSMSGFWSSFTLARSTLEMEPIRALLLSHGLSLLADTIPDKPQVKPKSKPFSLKVSELHCCDLLRRSPPCGLSL